MSSVETGKDGSLETGYLMNAIGLILTVVMLSLFMMDVYNPNFIPSNAGLEVVVNGPFMGGISNLFGIIITVSAKNRREAKRRFSFSLMFGVAGLILSLMFVAFVIYAVNTAAR